ncbi:MAG: glutathione synthase [Myxococcaceae bacterium]|nr:glutathione synthase [Myxococcaceae bacterium]
MKRSGLRIGFLMDPLEEVVVGHDTTFLLMLAAQARGHEVHCFEQHHLFFHRDRTWAHMRRVEVQRVVGRHMRVVDEGALPLTELDVVLLRKDPPVDAAFLHATQLVELHGGERGPLLVNAPAGLRDANEKLFALRLSHLMPPTLVSADLARLRAFVREEAPEAVLKPVDGYGGRGVFVLRAEDRNLTSLLETATVGGTRPVVVQAYLSAAREGDKRILLLDGEPMGAILRVPAEDEARANMAAGGRPERTTLTERERAICAALKPELTTRGLAFVGIDVIGGHLTEVNVTSPTGAEEVEALAGTPVGEPVMAWIEAQVAQRPSG